MQIGHDSAELFRDRFAVDSAVWHVANEGRPRWQFAVAQGLREAGCRGGRDPDATTDTPTEANTIAVSSVDNGGLVVGHDRREWGVAVARLRDGRRAAGHCLVTEAAARATKRSKASICVGRRRPCVRPAGPIALVAILVFVVLSAMAYALYQRSQPTMTAGTEEATYERASDISAAAQLTARAPDYIKVADETPLSTGRPDSRLP